MKRDRGRRTFSELKQQISNYLCSTLFVTLLAILFLLIAYSPWGGQGQTIWAKEMEDVAEQYPLYVPVVMNGAGNVGNAAEYQVAYVNDAGAWLGSFDGRYKTVLTTDVKLGVEEDIPVVQASPDGQYIAIHQSTGWAIFRRDGTLVRDRIGAGFALTWDVAWDIANAAKPSQSVLLAKKAHGIDRKSLIDLSISQLVLTSDDTYDHSPVWTSDGSRLVFAHHEFGTQLYVTLVEPFDGVELPLTGENLAAHKENDALFVIESVDSWHDQVISFYWSTNEGALIFAAKQTIYVVDMQSKDAVTITPPGFGERSSGRSVDVANDQILYFAKDGIYVVGLDGEGARRVVGGDDLHFPRWIDSGQQIVYRGTDDRLYRVNVDGSDNVVIPHSHNITQFVLLP